MVCGLQPQISTLTASLMVFKIKMGLLLLSRSVTMAITGIYVVAKYIYKWESDCCIRNDLFF